MMGKLIWKSVPSLPLFMAYITLKDCIGRFLFRGLCLFIFILFQFPRAYSQNGGPTCAQAVPLCTNMGTITQATNPGGIPTQGRCKCLTSTPNPQWYVLETSSSGQLRIRLSQQTQSAGIPIDIDYVLLGPITDMATACQNPCSLPQANCSYSSDAVENITANVQAGQVYLLMVTNYNGQASNISLENQSNVSTNCLIGSVRNTGPYCSGETIQLFTDLSIGANPNDFTYNWTGPNGFSSTLKDPTIPNGTAINSGEYVLTLSNGSETREYRTLVNINPIPDAAVTAPSEACVGDIVTFDASSTTPPSVNNFRWILTNTNTVTATTSTPTTQYTYTQAGTYNVRLIAGLAACADTATTQIIVHPRPNTTFSVPSTNCHNDMINMDAAASSVTSPYTISEYRWDYENDGIIDLTTSTPSTQKTYTIGSYQIGLTTVTNVGCSSSSTTNITVINYPEPDFTYQGACVGRDILFTNTTPVNSSSQYAYEWDFGDNSTPSQLKDPIHMYSAAGSYIVTLTVSNQNICSATAQQTLTITNDVIADFDYNSMCGLTGIYTDQSFSPGGSGTIHGWIWNFGDGNTSTTPNPTHTYSDNGIYPVQLVIYSSSGCYDTIVKSVERYDIPQASFSVDDVCLGFSSIPVDASGIGSGIIQNHIWDFGDGNTYIGNQPRNTYATDSTYTVRLVTLSEYGCGDTAYSTATVLPNPVAQFFTIPAFEVSLLEPNISLIDSSQGAIQWQWTVSNTVYTEYNDTPSPDWTFQRSGHYTIHLLVENQYGCTDEMKLPYQVTSVYNFFAPNAFTQDDDGLNEYWRVYTLGMTEMQLRIFNRWGEELYATEDPYFLWDGTVDGKRIQADIYVYVAETRDMEGRPHKHSGTITLIK